VGKVQRPAVRRKLQVKLKWEASFPRKDEDMVYSCKRLQAGIKLPD